MSFTTKTKYIATCLFLGAYSFVVFGLYFHQHKSTNKQEYKKEDSAPSKRNDKSCDFCKYIFNKYISKAGLLQLSFIYTYPYVQEGTIYSNPAYLLILIFIAKDRAPPILLSCLLLISIKSLILVTIIHG